MKSCLEEFGAKVVRILQKFQCVIIQFCKLVLFTKSVKQIYQDMTS